MVNGIYSIYDKATKIYAQPFYAQSDEVALRIVRGSFSLQSQLVLYPADYDLIYLGTFDDATGVIVHDDNRIVEHIRELMPVGLRSAALDGSFKECE